MLTQIARLAHLYEVPIEEGKVDVRRTSGTDFAKSTAMVVCCIGGGTTGSSSTILDTILMSSYNQDFASRAANPSATSRGLPGGITIAQSLQAFRDAMKGESTEVRLGKWYP